MNKLKNFLSPRRFWHNLWTHFPVPMGICIFIFFSFFFLDFLLESNPYYGIILALTFSTAASCIRRRFHIPMYCVFGATALGLVLGSIFGYGDVVYWLQMVSVGICVIVSCWTRLFYLQILLVPGWFALCFALTFFLEFFAVCVVNATSYLGGVLIVGFPFLLAPYLFLGGLPFGDEDFDE